MNVVLFSLATLDSRRSSPRNSLRNLSWPQMRIQLKKVLDKKINASLHLPIMSDPHQRSEAI